MLPLYHHFSAGVPPPAEGWRHFCCDDILQNDVNGAFTFKKNK